jgi:hypothetical protein
MQSISGIIKLNFVKRKLIRCWNDIKCRKIRAKIINLKFIKNFERNCWLIIKNWWNYIKEKWISIKVWIV